MKWVRPVKKCTKCKSKPFSNGYCHLCWSRWYRADNRETINENARRYARNHRELINKRNRDQHARKRKRQTKKFGKRCGMPGCKIIKRLCLHHDHRLQKKQRCCVSANGCLKCQVCFLCYKHNMVLGMLEDNPKEALKALRFLERHHVR